MAVAGMFLTALVLLPPVFSRHFAVGAFAPGEKQFLWAAAIAAIIVSFGAMRFRCHLSPGIIMLIITLLGMLWIELGARFTVVHWLAPWRKAQLAEIANRTYPSYLAYQGHPFLQFIGRPKAALKETMWHGEMSPFNKFGFYGQDFVYEKPPDVIRIACLGGSTTASGWPQRMERYLNEADQDGLHRYEVLNFGQGWYTTAHSLVNFVLNVVDFEPDYVVVHHAWNDAVALGAPKETFRGDYSHALKLFDPPLAPDRHLIRSSILYRWLINKKRPFPAWGMLGAATEIQDRPRANNKWSNPDELKTYQRNITTIIQVAKARGIKVVLATMPYCTDTNILYYGLNAPMAMQLFNPIMRQLQEEHKEEILFVDLDKMMTDKLNQVFVDVGHVNATGDTFKAEQVGRVIRADVENW